MSYQAALEAAGATVHDYREFGSYQGDWFAIVSYKGTNGVIQGAFGSCSGCDAFEGEFEGSYPQDDTPEELEELAGRMKKFGEGYLHSMMSIDEAVKYAEKDADWDHDAKAMVQWVRNLRNLQFANKLEVVLGSDEQSSS